MSVVIVGTAAAGFPAPGELRTYVTVDGGFYVFLTIYTF